MMSLLPSEATTPARVMPWTDPRFVLTLAVIPLVTLTAMLLWQDNARTAFRVIQLCFGWAVVVQMALVVLRVFERGWYEFFAYVLHFSTLR